MTRRAWSCALLLVAGCHVPAYTPEQTAVPDAPEAFAQVEGVFRARYPRLLVRDPEQFRLQSDWTDHPRADPPGRVRATLFRTDGSHIGVVVEVQWLRLGVLGAPFWTEPEGCPDLERDLAAAIAALYQG